MKRLRKTELEYTQIQNDTSDEYEYDEVGVRKTSVSIKSQESEVQTIFENLH